MIRTSFPAVSRLATGTICLFTLGRVMDSFATLTVRAKLRMANEKHIRKRPCLALD